MTSWSLGQSENGNITSRQGLPSSGLLMPVPADLVGRGPGQFGLLGLAGPGFRSLGGDKNTLTRVLAV